MVDTTSPNTLAPPEFDLSPAPQKQPWTWQLAQVASTYLPVMLMALLAIGTWWLVKNTVPPSDDRPVVAPRHEPDYEMHHFSVQRYTPAGSLEAQLEGEALRHYPDTDTLEIDNVRLRAVDAEGRTSVATAQHALSNGEQIVRRVELGIRGRGRGHHEDAQGVRRLGHRGGGFQISPHQRMRAEGEDVGRHGAHAPSAGLRRHDRDSERGELDPPARIRDGRKPAAIDRPWREGGRGTAAQQDSHRDDPSERGHGVPSPAV